MTEKLDGLMKQFEALSEKHKGVEVEAQEAKKKLLALYQQEMDSEDVPEETLREAKARYDDLNLKLEAAGEAILSVRQNIMAWVPEATRARLENIQEELEALGQDKKTLNKEYLALAAQAAARLEAIKGPSLAHDGKGNFAPAVRSLHVDMARMDVTDIQYFSQEVEAARKDTGIRGFRDSIDGKWESLQQERRRLEAVLQDPEREVTRLLGPLEEKVPAAIVPEDDRPRTTAVTMDYGDGQGAY
ncbi:MAG: hypothetical protein SWE60_05850 [Thermodesulfobacteriota bacterium]|nr:hypothetical protein [Thermodesulfobacteriota bacterium]